MTNRFSMAGLLPKTALLAALLIWAPSPSFAQNLAPQNPAAAAKAPAKLSRAMQKALSDHRRNIGRSLRGGPDDYYVIVLGEITDRPREPNLLDALHATTATVAFMWDILFVPVVLIAGDGEEVLMSQHVPPLRNTVERSYQHEVRIVHTKAAAIQAVFDYTTALVNAAPKPAEQRYRAWAFGGLARTEKPAQEAKAAVEEKLAAMAAKPTGFLEKAHHFLDQLGKDDPAKADPKAAPKQAGANKAGADPRERVQKLMDEARQKPDGLEKLREQLQQDFFGRPATN